MHHLFSPWSPVEVDDEPRVTASWRRADLRRPGRHPVVYNTCAHRIHPTPGVRALRCVDSSSSRNEMPHASSKINVFRLKRRDALVIGAAMFIGVATIDRLTSDEFSLTAFYLFPVLLIAWNCGRTLGLVFAILSVVAQSGQTPLDASNYTKGVYLYIAYANVFFEYAIVVVLTSMLRKIYEQERYTARIDPLTGVRNRKGFQEALATEVARHQRKGVGFCLA